MRLGDGRLPLGRRDSKLGATSKIQFEIDPQYCEICYLEFSSSESGLKSKEVQFNRSVLGIHCAVYMQG